MMAWIPFSLVSWANLLRVEGSVKSSAEEVRRRLSWMSWMDRDLMKTVFVEEEIRGCVQVIMLGETEP